MKKMKLPKIKIEKESICSFCAKGSFLMLVGSLALQVSVTNKYAVKGPEMVALIKQEQVLQKEVSLIKLEVSEVSSMAYIEARAAELGFDEYDLPVAAITPSQFAALTDY